MQFCNRKVHIVLIEYIYIFSDAIPFCACKLDEISKFLFLVHSAFTFNCINVKCLYSLLSVLLLFYVMFYRHLIWTMFTKYYNMQLTEIFHVWIGCVWVSVCEMQSTSSNVYYAFQIQCFYHFTNTKFWNRIAQYIATSDIIS